MQEVDQGVDLPLHHCGVEKSVLDLTDFPIIRRFEAGFFFLQLNAEGVKSSWKADLDATDLNGGKGGGDGPTHPWWIEVAVCRLPYGFDPSQVG